MSFKQNKKRRKNSSNEFNEYLKLQLISGIIYLTVFLVFSFVGVIADFKLKNIYYLSLVQFSLSSFAAGFICALKRRKNGLRCGISGALPINILIILISLILNGFTVDLRLIISFSVLILFSAIGGITSVNIKLRK